MKLELKKLMQLLAGLLCLLLTANMIAACEEEGGEDPFSQKGSEDVSELTDVVSRKPDTDMRLGFPEENIVNENNCTVSGNGYTVELTPTVVEGDTKLSVTPASQAPWMFGESDKVTAFDLKVGDLTEFKGVAKLRIPVTIGSGEVLVACRWDDQEHNWTPARCDYDRAKGEAIVYTDKPGTFGVTTAKAPKTTTRADGDVTFGQFIVARANTHYAGVYEDRFAFMDWEDDHALVISALFSKFLTDDKTGLISETDMIAQGILDEKSLYGDIGYSALKELGLKSSFLEKTSKFMGFLAVGASFYQRMRALAKGDFVQADGMALKGMLDFATTTATKVISTSAMNVGMIAVAIIDYSLNKFAEEAWRLRKDLYKRAYNLYYSEGEDGYRSKQQWFDLFWPAFTKAGMTEKRINVLIDAYVTKYCEQFWEDDLRISYYMGLLGVTFSGGGGLSDGLKKEVSDQYREFIYGDSLPSVFDAIGEKLQEKQYDIMKDQMMQYAKHINQVITLKFKDSSAKNGKSQYAGYTVKFKRLPLAITDPGKWECKLDDKGEGEIKFRLFAYAAAGVKPQMVVVENVLHPDDYEKELTLKNLEPGVNTVDLGDETVEMTLRGIGVEGYTTTIWYRYENDRLTGKYEKDNSSALRFAMSDYESKRKYMWDLQVDGKWHVEAKRAASDEDSVYSQFLSFDLPGGMEATSIKNLSFKYERTHKGIPLGASVGEYFISENKETWTIAEVPLVKVNMGNLKDACTLVFQTNEGEFLPLSDWERWSRTTYSNGNVQYNVYERRPPDSNEEPFRNKLQVMLRFNNWASE